MNQEGYRTKTTNIAAFLYVSKLHLVGTERVGNDVFFIFTPTEKAEQLVEQYFAGTATANPRDLFARQSDLRDLIFSGGNRA